MKFSESWLREWVDPAVETAQLVAQLTMAGLEVDSVEAAAPGFTGVVVGHVESVAQHPDADKLRVCRVSVGNGELLQIVCGAANVAQGQTVPVAIVGAELPGGLKIKRAKLRGVESQGMICSASELGLAEQSDGILVLPDSLVVGEDLRQQLQLDDQLIEVDLTPNRGDCLSLLGIAREVGVLNRVPVSEVTVAAVSETITSRLPVSLAAPEGCPRYVGRAVTGLDPAAQTPLWMQEKLRRCGVRSLGPLVDITNYVLLELGQPMHAFDLAKLKTDIGVRWSRAGEKLALLNGETVTLDGDTLLIIDGDLPVARAGIIGGDETAVGDETTAVFFESAFFAPEAIAGRARRYGLHTDASHRFERGVDPAGQLRAIERATQLLIDIAGGEAGPIVEAKSEAHLPGTRTIQLRRARIARVLGVALPDGDVVEILQRLGMEIEANSEGWTVRSPAYRFDVALEEDLIEELARIHGYDNLPVSRSHAEQEIKPNSESGIRVSRLATALIDRDYQEAITYSFVDPRLQSLLDPEHEPIPLANPISSDMAVMRTSLWPGLVGTVLHNQKRQQDRVRLFETGLRFRRSDGKVVQQRMIAGACSGPLLAQSWDGANRPVDFYDIKGDVEALLALTAQASDYGFVADSHPALHPGQSARIVRNGGTVGWIGQMHPSLSDSLDSRQPVYLFELELSSIDRRRMPEFREISRFPAIRRDLAVVVDEKTPVEQLVTTLRDAETKWLQDVQLFDIYRGKGVESGKKSVALGLTLQNSSRTLTDSEVDTIIMGMLERLRSVHNAVLRD